MSIDRLELGPNIRNYIELNNSLELVGIGRLVKRISNTYINSAGSFISPKSSIVELENCETNNDVHFISYLSDIHEITLDQAKVLYKKCCAEICFELETKGNALFFGLGQFIKKNKVASFYQNDNSLSVSTYGLPSLSITPLPMAVTESKNKISKKVIKPIRSGALKDRRDRNFLINTAAIAALFMLLVFSYHYYSSSESINQLSHLKVDQERLNKDPEKLLISEKFIPELIPGIFEKEENITSCALIIGSFSKQSNALKIQQKVLAAGFELYTEEFQDMYRVGVSLPCDEIQGATFRNIEEKLGIDPWLRIYH